MAKTKAFLERELATAKARNDKLQRELDLINATNTSDIARFLQAAEALTVRLSTPREPELYIENRISEVRGEIRAFRQDIEKLIIRELRPGIKKIAKQTAPQPTFLQWVWRKILGSK